ncbi:MAG: hypothetical protein ACLPVO_14555 [Desulfomonilaceae bacterium]
MNHAENIARDSLSPSVGTISNMTELDIQHKQDFEKFVLAETKGPEQNTVAISHDLKSYK